MSKSFLLVIEVAMLHSAALIDGESASNPGFSRGSIINLGIP